MTDHDTFSIDPDELAEIVRELAECKEILTRNLADLRKQMRILQTTWDGLAADAQAVAQEEWEKGMQTMNTALEDLIAANRTAHANYTGAARANLNMWQGLA